MKPLAKQRSAPDKVRPIKAVREAPATEGQSRVKGGIDVEQHGKVLLATIRNPPYALMTPRILRDLAALVQRVNSDPSVGAVVLTGAHPTRFLAHFDVRVILGSAEKSPRIKPSTAHRLLRFVSFVLKIPGGARLIQGGPLAGFVAMERMHELMRSIESSSAVWIAALNGDTGGGGCELALACDQRFMADGDFSIALPEIFLGFLPGTGSTQRLPRLVGTSKALRICLGGEPMSPQKALEAGLIDRVVPPAQLISVAMAEASKLGSRPKLAIGAVKRAIHHGASLPIEEGTRIEASEFLSVVSTPDSITAQRAYVKRMAELGDVPITDRKTVQEVLAKGRFE